MVLAETQRPLISLCMIARDNARTIVPCLESIRPWVGEMIVVDTGSRDDTPYIAKQLGAKVSFFPWIDDFSAARNESLRLASGEWLFWMDTDDTIDETNGRKLQQLAQRPCPPEVLAYVLQVHCPGHRGGPGEDLTVVDHVKLFRNHPEIRFEGRIHEQVLPCIRRLGGEVVKTDLYVVHSGSDTSPAGRERKIARDLRILERDLAERPEHPFVLFNLGMTYHDMEEFGQAVQWLERCLHVSPPQQSHVRKAYALLVCSLTQLREYEAASRYSQQGLSLYPEDPELWFRQGILAQQRDEWTSAVTAYQQALRPRKAEYFSSMDPGIVGYKTRNNLALALEQLGRPDLAEREWRQILAERKTYSPAVRGLMQVLLQQNRLMAAEIETEIVQERSPGCADLAILRAETAKKLGNWQEARQWIERAVTLAPEDSYPQQFLCRILFEHASPGETQQALTRLLELSPHDGAAWHNLGLTLLNQSDIPQAITALEESLRHRPDAQGTRQLLESLRAGPTPFPENPGSI